MNFKIKFAIFTLSLLFSLGLVSHASAASNVYYSVGQSTADLSNNGSSQTCTVGGNCTVSITSGVATFNFAQTGNIGVGDDVLANGVHYYISGKVSQTAWNVVTNTGATPTNIGSTALTSIKHVFTSLNTAVAPASITTLLGTTDLTSGSGYILNIPCYYDSGPDTTSVAVSGYTTSAADYIRIYTPVSTTTEANNSQRASGKWNNSKYSLVITQAVCVNIAADNVVVDGLQMKDVLTTGTGRNVVQFSQSNIKISNNILTVDITGLGANSANVFGINIATSTTAKVFNNIIYGFNYVNPGSALAGVYTMTSAGTLYFYNNTMYNNYFGFRRAGLLTSVLKNNIAYNNGTDYAGSFDSSSTNNLSKDATAPGTNAKINQTVAFVSTVPGAEDLHLSPTDTAAKDAGADLSADANLAFNTDIDGNTRNAAINPWDIGADESATPVYFSVGQNTTDHKTGSPTVTVSGTTATFSVAQTATNMGVGDLVTYTGGTCYISAKTNADQMHWNCVSATGGQPAQVAGVSVTSIAHAFSSLNGAVNAGNANGAFDASHLNTKDLVAGNYQLNIPCYYDTGADTTAVTVQSWNTGAQNNIRIYTPVSTTSEVNQTQRHGGKWDSTKYNLTVSSAAATGINLWNQFVTIDGLQINNAATSGYSQYGIAMNQNTFVSNNIIKYTGSGGTDLCGINYTLSAGNFKVGIWNNIIYNFKTGIFGSTGGGSVVRAYLYNNTIYGGSSSGFNMNGYHDALLTNNITQNCATGFVGNPTSASDYNLSSDATAPGTHSKINTTVAFVSTTPGAEDFHLSASDTAAKNAGVDLSADANLAFTTDIDGEMRPSGKWDIGADENNNVNIQINRNVKFGRNVNIK